MMSDEFEVIVEDELKAAECPKPSSHTGTTLVREVEDQFTLISTLEAEHRALREDVIRQNELLKQVVGEQSARVAEMEALRKKEAELEAVIVAEEAEKTQLRAEVDGLTAQLLHANDVIKVQETAAAGRQSGPSSQEERDARLAAELAGAASRLEEERKRREEAETALMKAREGEASLAQEVASLKHHVSALEVQVIEDRSYIDELQRRRQLESSGSTEEATINFLTAGRRYQQEGLVFECPQCKIRIPDDSLAEKHRAGCKPGDEE